MPDATPARITRAVLTVDGRLLYDEETQDLNRSVRPGSVAHQRRQDNSGQEWAAAVS